VKQNAGRVDDWNEQSSFGSFNVLVELVVTASSNGRSGRVDQ